MIEPVYSSLVDAHKTFGPEVAELSSLAGFVPDAEQQLLLDQTFAVDRRGNSLAFEVACIAPRQNLKTGWLKMSALGFMFVMDTPLLIWSAHEFSTAQEALKDMTQLIESTPELDREVQLIRHANGDESITLVSGARLLFKARTKGGGRGLSGDKVILDEAFALKSAQMGALLPTLTARPNPQVLYGSSAGLVDSAVLRGVRDRGRAGSDPRLAYAEWSDDQAGQGCLVELCDHVHGTRGCALDDEARWARTNTALGKRITLETLRAFRRSMPPEEFAREFLGWWSEPASRGTGNDISEWLECESDAEPTGDVFFAADVSPGHGWASIVACGDGVLELVDRRPGSSWLPSRMRELAERHHGRAFALDQSGPIGALLPDFDGLDVMRLDGAEVARACEAITAAVSERRLSHRGEPELMSALTNAGRRLVGDGWKWSRKDSRADISPLCAATWAHWAWLSRNTAANRPITPDLFFV